jgi:hypothetical protein
MLNFQRVMFTINFQWVMFTIKFQPGTVLRYGVAVIICEERQAWLKVDLEHHTAACWSSVWQSMVFRV